MTGISSLGAQIITRGPYLQQSTESSCIVHWRTNLPCASELACSPIISPLTFTVSDTSKVTEHIMKITGLQPGTKYYYNIGDMSQMYFPPSSNLYFHTHPPQGSTGHYRFWVVGDAGMGDNNQRMVRDAFFYVNNGKKLDGWLWLGDNAYYSGLETEYQNNIFSNNTYENVLKNLVAWAAPGNHDYANNVNNSNPEWLTIFDFPANGEAGGLPSGTEKYFSWNYGNIHFVQLDSYQSDRADSAAMATWLKADLAQNNLTWTIIYFHHPPYTKGTHDSDNSSGGDPELPHLRINLVPIFEEYGADLVLSGHSHNYERSKLIDGHYDYSSTLADSMIIDSTGGNYPAGCAYSKDSIDGVGHKGTVYAVVGSSGKTGGTQASWPHPVMHTAFAYTLGSMLLEVHENKLQTRFINDAGVVLDSFTIVKHMKTRKFVSACKDSALTLFPSWHENAQWEPMNTNGDSLVIFPASDTIVIAHDFTNCLTDTIEVHIVPDSVCAQMIGMSEVKKNNALTLFPNPGNGCFTIVSGEDLSDPVISISDLSGKIVFSEKKILRGKSINLEPAGLKNGIYFVRVQDTRNKMSSQKILVVINK